MKTHKVNIPYFMCIHPFLGHLYMERVLLCTQITGVGEGGG
jgi:hypothetical protein